MTREFLMAKLHGATVKVANLNYRGSVAIDEELLEKSGMTVHEKVLVANLENGKRSESYIIKAPRGSKMISMNGGMAHHHKVGDRVLIMTFCCLSPNEIAHHKPIVLILSKDNDIEEISSI